MKTELIIFLGILTTFTKNYTKTDTITLIWGLMITAIIKSNLKLTNKYRLYSIIFSFISLGLVFIFADDLTNYGQLISWSLKSICVFSMFFLGIELSYYNKNVLFVNILPGVIISIIGFILQLQNAPIDLDIKEYIPLANNLFDFYSFVIKNNLLTNVLMEAPLDHFILACSFLLTVIQNIMLCMGIYFYINYFFIKK